jgi:hypothetical protein
MIRHALRKDLNNITRQGLNWNPQGERKKGRRRTTSWKKLKQIEKKIVRWRKFAIAVCFTSELQKIMIITYSS